MIDKVILYDIKCGKDYISTLEARQILGRAGRTYNKFEQGETYIFGQQHEIDKINQYYYGNDNNIKSNLIQIDKIAFHMMPDIQFGLIKNKDDMKQWYDETLASLQNNTIDVDKLYDYLIETKCINQKFQLLINGQLSVQYYYTPNRINVLNEKLQYLNSQNDFSINAFAWLLAYYSGNIINHPIYEYFQQQKSSKYYLNYNQQFDFFVYFLILNRKSIKKISSYIAKTRKDIFRLLAMLKKMCKKQNIDIENDLKLIENMIYYNSTREETQLMMKFKCYDRNFISKLIYFNIQNIQDLEYKLDYIKVFFDNKTFNKCLNLIKEIKNDRQTY